jgi:formate--tetrahydrofolate ligase
MAMTFGEYAITEAGFGADLGAEKFFDIKCRKAGITPAATVLIVTSAALEINGWENVERHLDNLHRFGQTVIVCLNKFPHDTEEKIAEIRSHIEALGVPFAVNRSYAEGGAGAEEFAQTVINTIEATEKKPLNFAYADTDGVKEKIEKICRDMYGAAEVTYSDEANAAIEAAYAMNQQHFPICIAKTQYSFSTDSKVTGAPTGHTVHIRNIVINSGAEMIVAVAGAIMRMPGLSKSPQAERIDIVNGLIEGLS